MKKNILLILGLFNFSILFGQIKLGVSIVKEQQTNFIGAITLNIKKGSMTYADLVLDFEALASDSKGILLKTKISRNIHSNLIWLAEPVSEIEWNDATKITVLEKKENVVINSFSLIISLTKV